MSEEVKFAIDIIKNLYLFINFRRKPPAMLGEPESF